MKRLLILLCLISSIFFANSQEKPTKTNEIDEIVDELLMEESFNDLLASLTNSQFSYFSVNYSNQT